MMDLFLIHPPLISLVLLTSLYHFGQGSHIFLRSESIPKNVNHHLSTMINDIDKERQNRSFSIIVRMIAFGIQHTDDEKHHEQKKLDNPGWSMTHDIKHLVSSNKNSDQSKEKIEDVQRDTRLLLLPLMIRILLERIAERTQQSEHIRRFSKINSTDKYNNFYQSIRGLIDITQTETTTVIIFMILSFIVLLFTVFSIIRRLRDTEKFNTISLSISGKQSQEETKKLLP